MPDTSKRGSRLRRVAAAVTVAAATSVALAPVAHADDVVRVVQVYDCTSEFRTPFDLAAYTGQPGVRLLLSIYGTTHPVECVVLSDGFRYFQQVDVMGIPHPLVDVPNFRFDYWTSINYYPI